MLNLIKKYITKESCLYTALFAILAIGGWFGNALYGYKFVLSDLIQIYGFIIAHLNVNHAIDSKYNSKEGEKP